MKTANLYVRVSTDEQAEKGYSQRNQEEVLRRYCEIKSIQVGRVYYEDHSAKTFKRPVWNNLLVDLRKYRGQADLVLFTKWDRFSRNAGDAYHMLNVLGRFGIEAQAIEQPLDLDIPENKMMLAFYLAAPEVENDRRSLNIFHGTRRAKKEGRWVATAPVGYANLSHENGKKYIGFREPQATAMREAFEELAKGRYTVTQVFRQAKEKGITCGYKNFWNIIRNPVYCGKILIPKYKDEDEYFVNGQHEALISEGLFYEVQEFLDGKKKKKGTKIVSFDELPLRGFLDCPKCSRKLTGSASKGQAGAYYYYYHCSAICKVRFKAGLVNTSFLEEVNQVSIREGYEPFYLDCLSRAFRQKSSSGDYSQRQVIGEIKELNGKIERARELLLSGEFTGTDFQSVKSKCEKEIISLESKLPDIIRNARIAEQLLDRGMMNLKKLNYSYKDNILEVKRKIISSMYPQNLVFDSFKHRTIRINEIVGNIFLINSALGVKKNWTSAELSDLSSVVVYTEQKSNSLVDDLEKIALLPVAKSRDYSSNGQSHKKTIPAKNHDNSGKRKTNNLRR